MDTFKLGFNFHGLPSTHTYASIIHLQQGLLTPTGGEGHVCHVVSPTAIARRRQPAANNA